MVLLRVLSAQDSGGCGELEEAHCEDEGGQGGQVRAEPDDRTPMRDKSKTNSWRMMQHGQESGLWH